jgi:uncharacterized protein (TIGR02001 family)
MLLAPCNETTVIAAEAASGVTLQESPVTPFEHWDVSGDVALVSDYRLGGVTRSGHAAALQAGIDAAHHSGWSVGASASSVDKRKGGHFEMEVHAAKTFAIGDTELSVGALWAMIPEAEHEDFGIAQVSASRTIGPVDVTLAVNYAWAQPNIDDDDNYSVRLRARTLIGRLAGAPITLGASVGHAEGSITLEDTKNDWSVSATAAVGDVDIGLAYIDTDLEDERGDGALVLSFAARF